MPTVKKLEFANGTAITQPTDLNLEVATNSLPVFPDDISFEEVNDLIEGSIYLNTTLKAPRMYINAAWRTGIVQENASDATKKVAFDADGSSSSTTSTLEFNSTESRVYTFPNLTSTIVLEDGSQDLNDKTIKNGFLDGTTIKNGELDVDVAGNLTLGASIGANNLTLGGADSTVMVPGNLTVSGTTTTVDTENLDVKDKNILINKGGNDAVSEGSGLTVDRDGTKGSLIYKSSAPNKFAAGDLGEEKNLAAIEDINVTQLDGVLAASKGGTGVANNDLATLTRSGNHSLTLTTTDETSVTLPTSGTLATITDINDNVFSGVLPASKGGTGVANNNAATLTRSGDHALTMTTTAPSSVTLPTAGTLSTLAGEENLLSKKISSTSSLTGALTLPVGTTGQQPDPAAQGMVRYNTTEATFEGYDGADWGAIGGGGGGGTLDVVNQVGHALDVGDVVYLNGPSYEKAIASAANTAEVVGVVSKVNTVDQFELTLSGEVSGLTGLVAGEVYFLSAATAGALTVDEPTTVGHVSLPVGVASSDTTLYVAPKRGVVVGATNARTQIPLANNANTTVQNVSAYEAGELSGWVAISATTPLKFYVNAQFSKNGAGNNYNISYQTSGDTPPVGFLLQVTAAGLIQAVLPAIAGFGSASITYGLDVAAIGTSFPLSVSARSVLGDTSGTAVPSGYLGEKLDTNGVGVAPAASGSYKTIASKQLTPGIWLVSGTGVFSLGTMSGHGFMELGIHTSPDAQPGTETRNAYNISTLGSTSYQTGVSLINLSSNATYYLNARINYSSVGTALWTSSSVIKAWRIA